MAQPPAPDASDDSDDPLRAASPALFAALSPLGRRLRMPANFLPQQTAEARGKRFNATIGQITDGHGRAVPLPSLAAALAGLPEAARSRALLYSPVEGLAELRERWRARQRRGQPADRPSSLPLATGGAVHALSLAAQLFAAPGRPVLVPDPVPAGYSEIFGLRTAARLLPVALEPGSLAAALGALPAGEPVLLAVSASPVFPAPAERAALVRALVEAAAQRPILVLVDDRAERLDPADGETASGSLFWDLIDRHPALVPLKADGAEGELGYPGGGIGFLTLPFPPDSPAARELEAKLKLLLRAEIGSPSAASQMVLLAGLEGG
jgi:hypothetical protein